MSAGSRLRVSVVVLGDVGRSPRMLYHALALASGGADVDVVGYAGSPVRQAIRDHAHIDWHFLGTSGRDAGPARLPFVVSASLKVLRQCVRLVRILFEVPKPDVILVQNPPAIPTLLLALVAARLRRAKLVVDWHNFGYTMLALRLGPRHPLVRVARWYERVLGRRADAHLCVSRAMQATLRDDWGIADAVVLHDRPADHFGPTPGAQREELFRRLGDTVAFGAGEDAGRPALLVSPTSWTADEDFSVLLDALEQCDDLTRARAAAFPPLLVLITGQGPLRGHYEARIARLSLGRIRVRTLWLAPEDYPLLLGAADLGLCLHRSSSGVDLPMKIADMFGSGLPVCALDYGPCLAELVRHDVDGLLFRTSGELAAQLYALFRGFPVDRSRLDRLRENVEPSPRWADAWNAVAWPVFRR